MKGDQNKFKPGDRVRIVNKNLGNCYNKTGVVLPELLPRRTRRIAVYIESANNVIILEDDAELLNEGEE